MEICPKMWISTFTLARQTEARIITGHTSGISHKHTSINSKDDECWNNKGIPHGWG